MGTDGSTEFYSMNYPYSRRVATVTKTHNLDDFSEVKKERDELRAKLDRIADIANAEKEVAIICRRPGAAFGFDKIIKECE